MISDNYQLHLDSILDHAEPFIPKYSEEELLQMGKTLQDILNSYRIPSIVKNGKCGTMVTRFEIKIEMSKGARIEQITSRLEEIALGLGVSSAQCRREEGTLFLEIPNGEVQKITIREVLENSNYAPGNGKLLIALGKTVSGEPVLLDIADAPHILIAGGTGSGKSVCLNAMIINLLLTKSPSELRMILIDPKQVEFKDYSNIPHLLHSIINDTDTLVTESIEALEWAKFEMNRRGKLFAQNARSCKNIGQYNDIQLKAGKKPLPYILIIIDEYADLIHCAESISKETKNELEGYIKTLAAKARFAGIHLVIATQRPAADIITKEIKDNITKRICFQVADNASSRLVISDSGAETLQGHGDFLTNGKNSLIHAQGMYVSDEEIANIVDLWSSDEYKVARLQSFREHSFFSDNPKKEVCIDMTTSSMPETSESSKVPETSEVLTSNASEVANHANSASIVTNESVTAHSESGKAQDTGSFVTSPVANNVASNMANETTNNTVKQASPEKASFQKPEIDFGEEPIDEDIAVEEPQESPINIKSDSSTIKPRVPEKSILKEKTEPQKEVQREAPTPSIRKKSIAPQIIKPRAKVQPKASQDTDAPKEISYSKFFFDPKDGETYNVIRIGNQIWMAENYRFASDNSLSINDNESNDNPFGRLYTWEDALQIVPEGWRLPTLDDWRQLNAFILKKNACKTGTALKSKDNWAKSFNNQKGEDIYDFTAYPTGFWNCITKDFSSSTYCTNFWTSTRYDEDRAYSILLHYLNENIKAQAGSMQNRFSIRFIMNI